MEHTWQEDCEVNVAESGFMEEWRETPNSNDMATIGDMLDVPADIDWVSYILVLVIEGAFCHNIEWSWSARPYLDALTYKGHRKCGTIISTDRVSQPWSKPGSRMRTTAIYYFPRT